MSLIMGIDTGGTYTDGVIIQYSSKKILCKAKALTTKEDLTIGINKCIQSLNFTDFNKISLVSLSTTLATNAIVEGKNCRTGLILIGGRPDGELPADQLVILQGKFDIKGRTIENLDENEVLNSIEKFRGKVDAIAISGYASVRNPIHELYVKNKVREILGIPVACAHELTCSLGFYDRTITTILNASLIPIIDGLIGATKVVLQKNNISAPIMVVRGDGSLMQEAIAIDRPIETILSGPAASIIGGIFLTNSRNAIIMDMGGTTTDIANIQDGVVKIKKEGAKVGGWLTRVKAAEISTFGIGGDSYLHINMEGQLEVGPQKVWPLCVIGKKYPKLIDELENFNKKEGYMLCFAQKTDCFMLVKKPIMQELKQLDKDIINILEDGPHSIFYLSHKLGKDVDNLELHDLANTGVIERISLTPTDILHVEGRYSKWDKKIAEIGVKIFAEQLNLSVQEFLNMAKELITNKLCIACLQSLAEFENQNFNFMDNNGTSYLIEKGLRNAKRFELFDAKYSLKKPILALGAPAAGWMYKVSEKLNTTLMLPEHSEVANAVGAAVGPIMETVEALIRPDKATKCFIVYGPWERKCFDTLENAVEYAVSKAKKYVITKCPIDDFYDIQKVRNDIYTDISVFNTKRIYVETRIKVIAVGKPSCRC